MALADITLNDGQGTPVAHTFSYTGMDGKRVIRSDLAASPETPFTMTISHGESTKTGGLQTKTHMVRWDKTVLDTDNITALPNNIRIVAEVSNRAQSDALADDLAAMLRNFATSANIRALFKGSVM